LKDKKALEYIEWGERQTTANGVFWKEVPSVKGRRLWYLLDKNDNDDFIIPRTFNDIYICHFGGVNYSDRFYGIVSEEKKLTTFFNSSLFIFLSECLAKQGLGLGALDLNIRELVRIPILVYFDINLIIKREIKSVFTEIGFDPTRPIREQEPNPLPDRKEIDDIVFDALGLTAEERKEVYWAVAELAKARLDKAKSV
ncbi:MAG: hypothetical protein PWR04_772, partial [Anaerophaga sp.]|nr:hypothetical protein [Anaerophaga sp.]